MSWWDTAIAQIKNLTDLKIGWDGYKAGPIKFENAYFTLEILKSLGSQIICPDIVPGTSGDLQLEWHYGQYSIELHVMAPYKVKAWRCGPTITNGTQSLCLTNDYTVVMGWISEFQLMAKVHESAAA